MNDRNAREFVAALGAAVALAGCNQAEASDDQSTDVETESTSTRPDTPTSTPTPERTRRPTPSRSTTLATETENRETTTPTGTSTRTRTSTPSPTATPVPTEDSASSGGGGVPATGGSTGGSGGGGSGAGSSGSGTGGSSGGGTAGGGSDGSAGDGSSDPAESGDATDPQPTATPTPAPDGPLDDRETNVVDVEATALYDGRHMFAVTLHHDAEDGEHASAWQVETRDGDVLGRLDLPFPHDDQPFTSLERIAVPDEEDCVVVRGQDASTGFGGQAMVLSLATGETTAVRQGPSKESLAAVPRPGDG